MRASWVMSMNRGRAVAANRPRMTMTITSSIKVKPPCLVRIQFSILINPDLAIYQQPVESTATLPVLALYVARQLVPPPLVGSKTVVGSVPDGVKPSIPCMALTIPPALPPVGYPELFTATDAPSMLIVPPPLPLTSTCALASEAAERNPPAKP